ncbi:STAS domain-containing protein [Streptomyces sp. NPDC007355]|uniref:STAS domain-containing protein n=1 Tax=Streptomyces sp. NPDC007355 TaxID=3364778 RepID=UPI0036B18AF1
MSSTSPPHPASARPSAAPSTTTSGSSSGRLTFCDCAGLSALITVQKTARAHGTALSIRNLPPQLMWLLRHVPHTLPIAPDGPHDAPAPGPCTGSR